MCSSCAQQVAVAVMRKFVSRPERSTGDAGLDFAKHLHDKWGVGHANCNDGVLFLVSIEDRIASISTGNGVKDRLNEDRIVQTIIPFMKKQQYAEGVIHCVTSIGHKLGEQREQSSYLPTAIGIFVLGVFL